MTRALRAHLGTETLASPIVWLTLAALIGGAALMLDQRSGTIATPPAAKSFYGSNDAVLVDARSDAPFTSWWSFATTTVPKGWEIPERARLRPADGKMSVTTSQLAGGYQLISPERTLDPGSYEAVVNGSVRLGGITVGVVDAAQDRWLGTSNYWSGQPFTHGKAMAASFRIFEPTRVRIILANWAPAAIPSSWLLTSVGLRARIEERVPVDFEPPPAPVADFYRANATPVDPPRGSGPPPQEWDFTNGPAQGWNVYNGATSSTYAGGTVLKTVVGTSDHQLSGPPLELGAGSYALVVEGRIPRGGLEIGALDTATNAFYGTSRFWGGQVPGDTNAHLTAWFSLPAPARVQIIVANWAPEPISSVWTIRTIRLERDPRARAARASVDAERVQPAERTTYTRGASPLSGPDRDPSYVIDWRFTSPWWKDTALPSGWRPLASAQIEQLADATLVVAPREVPGPQVESVGPTVAPGRYVISVEGRVLAGGLALEAKDTAGRLLGQQRYWSGQQWRAGATMRLEITVTRRTLLSVSFASWQSRPRVSAWAIRRVTLARVGS